MGRPALRLKRLRERAKNEVPDSRGRRQRLSERFLNSDVDALAAYEPIEVVLFVAIPRRSNKLLAKSGSTGSAASPMRPRRQESGRRMSTASRSVR
jgi:hypothetical protein